MLKLMKYEFKKQMFSKLIMAIGLGVLGIFFLVFNYSGDKGAAETMMALMGLGMMIAMFYAIFECMMVYEKDLTTKQSYMLFLVPQSSKSILGAKILAAILQILLTFVMFGGGLVLCFSLYCMKYDGMKAFFEEVKVLIEAVFQIQIDIPLVLTTCAELFIVWMFSIMLGVFLTTVMNTVMNNKSKLNTAIVVILYFICFWLVLELSNLIDTLIVGWPDMVQMILAYAYMIGLDLLLFFGSAWLMEKKLSV